MECFLQAVGRIAAYRSVYFFSYIAYCFSQFNFFISTGYLKLQFFLMELLMIKQFALPYYLFFEIQSDY